MIRNLFHGSDKVVEKPYLGGGKRYNDYGYGFYCTELLNMAKEWSVDPSRDGFVNKYEIETDGLNILNLNDKKYNILHWLTILLQNRTFDIEAPLAKEAKDYLISHYSVPLDGVDIIIGYRADDSYFDFAQDFINGTISYRQLSIAMRLGHLGQQFVLVSEKAFERIKYIGYEPVKADVWYKKKKARDSKAKSDYFNADKYRRIKGDIYITDIIDEDIKIDDPRLQ